MIKCEVKMAGYWPSSFLCVFVDQNNVEVHKLAKKELGQYPAILTEQIWSIKDLLYGFRGNFSCGIHRVRVVPSRSGSQLHCAIWVILPARWASRIIMRLIIWQSPQYPATLTEQTWSMTHIYKPPNICARACDWSQHVTWPNIPQLKLGNIRDYYMATIVRALWLAAERALFSWNGRALWNLFSVDDSFELWVKLRARGRKQRKRWTKVQLYFQ